MVTNCTTHATGLLTFFQLSLCIKKQCMCLLDCSCLMKRKWCYKFWSFLWGHCPGWHHVPPVLHKHPFCADKSAWRWPGPWLFQLPPLQPASLWQLVEGSPHPTGSRGSPRAAVPVSAGDVLQAIGCLSCGPSSFCWCRLSFLTMCWMNENKKVCLGRVTTE